MLKVKIKKLSENAVIPSYSKEGDAGMDLTAITVDYENETLSYGTGISLEIPEGYVGLIYPRSSIFKKDLVLSNSVGVIDSGYRGEIGFKFKTTLEVSGSMVRNDKTKVELSSATFNTKLNIYEVGDRIGQIIIMPYPKVEFEEVEELSQTDRGEGGYGSTGI